MTAETRPANLWQWLELALAGFWVEAFCSAFYLALGFSTAWTAAEVVAPGISTHGLPVFAEHLALPLLIAWVVFILVMTVTRRFVILWEVLREYDQNATADVGPVSLALSGDHAAAACGDAAPATEAAE